MSVKQLEIAAALKKPDMTHSVEVGGSRLVPQHLQRCGGWLMAFDVYRRHGGYLGALSSRRDGTFVNVAWGGQDKAVPVTSIGVGIRLLQAVIP